MKTKIDELKEIKSKSNRERWFLKNLMIFREMKVRKTRAGYTVYNSYSKFYVEFSDEEDLAFLENDLLIHYPSYLYVYKEKDGNCWKEIVLRDIVDKMVELDKLLKG